MATPHATATSASTTTTTTTSHLLPDTVRRTPLRTSLATAAPITCLDDLVQLSNIPTKLNNLQLPAQVNKNGHAYTGTKHIKKQAQQQQQQQGSKVRSASPAAAFSTTIKPPLLQQHQHARRLSVSAQDVVMNGNSQHNNAFFDSLVRQNVANYVTNSANYRKNLQLAILTAITRSGGRFLTKAAINNTFFEAEPAAVERFIDQALQAAATERRFPYLQLSAAASGTQLATPHAFFLPSMMASARFATTARAVPQSEHVAAGAKKKKQLAPRKVSYKAVEGEGDVPAKKALAVKFKRPKDIRKVSLESRNPLDLLSHVATFGSMSDSDGEEG